MPKKIVTTDTIPIIMSILDRWKGKLTWSLFCKEVSTQLNVETVSRHTLLGYKQIAEEFEHAKIRLKQIKEDEVHENEHNVTLDWALNEIDTLRNRISRIESENNLLKQRFIQWQRNYYMMNGVDMVKLDEPELVERLNRPFPRK